jgi:hypothetical protein
MILFYEDWLKYPTATIHYETRNRSFVRQASVYKAMGIKNHAFILALVNPELRYVDPFDPNLTMEQMGMVAMECKINPWYFFREVARVPAQATPEPVSVDANRGNIALWWCFFTHAMIILIQIRQTGKSLSSDLLMVLLLEIMCVKTKINLLTKDDDLRRGNIRRMKDIMEELPRYLDQRTRDDANNTEEVTVHRLGNIYSTHVPQASPKRANNMGRGLTSAIFQIDEGPFQVNIHIALQAALAATTAAREAAEKAGAPYGTILTTTAGKKDEREGAYIYNIVEESAVWTEKFFDCQNQQEFEAIVRKNSRNDVFQINATFNHRQLGKTDEWLYKAMQSVKAEGDNASRDYFNLWTSGTASSPFSVQVAQMIRDSYRGEDYTDISKPDGYITRWYIPENTIEQRLKTGKFVLGMDTSDASGGDDISLIIVDVEDGATIACGTYNETNLMPFAAWVCSILVAYKNITAIIERRSTGVMLIDYLLWMLPQHGEDPFKRLFNRVVNDHLEYPDRYQLINCHVRQRPAEINTQLKKHFGFATSGSGLTSRTELYSTTLNNALKLAGNRMYDNVLINQTLGLVTKNGRIDHQDGQHDDLVIGWLLCHWLISQGTNLQFYGIDSRMVMKKAVAKKPLTPAEEYAAQEQERVKAEIEKLYTRLSSESDEFVSMRLEQELILLSNKLIQEDNDLFSVDELIRQARETRKQNKRVSSLSTNQSIYSELKYANMGHEGTFSDTPWAGNDYYYGRRRY